MCSRTAAGAAEWPSASVASANAFSSCGVHRDCTHRTIYRHETVCEAAEGCLLHHATGWLWLEALLSISGRADQKCWLRRLCCIATIAEGSPGPCWGLPRLKTGRGACCPPLPASVRDVLTTQSAVKPRAHRRRLATTPCTNGTQRQPTVKGQRPDHRNPVTLHLPVCMAVSPRPRAPCAAQVACNAVRALRCTAVTNQKLLASASGCAALWTTKHRMFNLRPCGSSYTRCSFIGLAGRFSACERRSGSEQIGCKVSQSSSRGRRVPFAGPLQARRFHKQVITASAPAEADTDQLLS